MFNRMFSKSIIFGKPRDPTLTRPFGLGSYAGPVIKVIFQFFILIHFYSLIKLSEFMIVILIFLF